MNLSNVFLVQLLIIILIIISRRRRSSSSSSSSSRRSSCGSSSSSSSSESRRISSSNSNSSSGSSNNIYKNTALEHHLKIPPKFTAGITCSSWHYIAYINTTLLVIVVSNESHFSLCVLAFSHISACTCSSLCATVGAYSVCEHQT